MHLLDPRGLWLLAGLGPLVLLYVLKIRRRRQLVSSTWLWTGARRDLVAKHPFRRLVPEAPLLLEIAALVVLALVVGRLSACNHAVEGDHVAIVLDASASMGTGVGGVGGVGGADGAGHTVTRMDRAKEAARGIVDRLAAGSDAMVIVATREARVACPPERDVVRLEAALRDVQAADVEGDLAPAIALAADRLRSLGGRGRLVIVTDGALARREGLVVSGVTADVVRVGDDEDNAGVVGLEVRSSLDAPGHKEQVQVFALIQSWGTRPREAYVTVSVEGHTEPVASRRLRLGPEDKQPVVLSFEPADEDRGRGLVVEISPGDAMPADDRAYARVPPPFRMPVVLVSATAGAGSWFGRALEADDNVDLRRLDPATLDRANLDPGSLVVLEGLCPGAAPAGASGPALPAWDRGGDVLVAAPPPGTCLGVEVGAPVEDPPPLTSWEEGDPRMRFLTLDGVHLAHATPLRPRGAGASLVRARSTTLIADASTPGRTATIVGFDPGDSDWPLKASFVLFVRNVVEVARGHRLDGPAGITRTGDAPRVEVPAGCAKVTFDGAGLTARDFAVRDGVATLPSLDRAGLYHARWFAPHVGEAVIGASLASAAESDVRPRDLDIAVAGEGSAPATGPATTPLAAREAPLRWLAALAALALALDLWWATRSRARRAGAP